MKWVSYTRSISSRIGEENPSNTIAEQNERIARYLKKCGCSVSEKYSDRRRTAEATEGFDKLVQDGMARKFDMQKTEQKTEQQAGLGMSFCEEEGRITVFRKTLEALEWPSHYRFLYNRKMKQIAVQACGAEESGAHRVGKPDESNSGEIKCMALVRMIYGDSGWDKKMSYRLIGRAFPQQRLVSFKITDAMQIENGRVLTEM